ncbi:uncharacterized protein [Lepisosteus oculatus]|uniref:uncharacterized protein n=1 Tax=Lepisosteus oculatus TaxID=7918 RepID=UPI0035F51A45
MFWGSRSIYIQRPRRPARLREQSRTHWILQHTTDAGSGTMMWAFLALCFLLCHSAQGAASAGEQRALGQRDNSPEAQEGHGCSSTLAEVLGQLLRQCLAWKGGWAELTCDPTEMGFHGFTPEPNSSSSFPWYSFLVQNRIRYYHLRKANASLSKFELSPDDRHTLVGLSLLRPANASSSSSPKVGSVFLSDPCSDWGTVPIPAAALQPLRGLPPARFQSALSRLQAEAQRPRRTKRCLLCKILPLIYVKSSDQHDGRAVVHWQNIHDSDEYSRVALYPNADSSPWGFLTKANAEGVTDGYLRTRVPVHPNMEARFYLDPLLVLLERKSKGYHLSCYEDPTYVSMSMRLQLVAQHGQACARVFIDVSQHPNWRNEVYYWWVGFYSSRNRAANEHQEYQWVTKASYVTSVFLDEEIFGVYDVGCGGHIGPRMNVRIFGSRDYSRERARTPEWDC